MWDFRGRQQQHTQQEGTLLECSERAWWAAQLMGEEAADRIILKVTHILLHAIRPLVDYINYMIHGDHKGWWTWWWWWSRRRRKQRFVLPSTLLSPTQTVCLSVTTCLSALFRVLEWGIPHRRQAHRANRSAPGLHLYPAINIFLAVSKSHINKSK